MPLELVTIPCLEDNYAFLIHDAASGATALVDAPEPGPILAELSKRAWQLSDILLTHHHWDHVDGVPALLEATGARIWGAEADRHRLPPLHHALSPGQRVEICGEEAHIHEVSGHTVGHIAFHFPQSKLLFTGDSLMALGCGRLFEGDPAMMWDSLSRLMALPPESIVCSGHEYTQSNANFALTIDATNQALISRNQAIGEARAKGQATVPSLLSEELATNPFLRPADPAIRQGLGMQNASDAEVFAEIRGRKDRF